MLIYVFIFEKRDIFSLYHLSEKNIILFNNNVRSFQSSTQIKIIFFRKIHNYWKVTIFSIIYTGELWNVLYCNLSER